jgi:Hint domain
MNENDEERLCEQAQRSKLDFLAIGARNVLAIGAIAASAAALRTTRAMASDRDCDADDPCCFLRGTKIQTVAGERHVEDLVIGDVLPTVFGGPSHSVDRAVPR